MNITISPEMFSQVQAWNCTSQRTWTIDSINAYCQGIPVWLYLVVCASMLSNIVFIVLHEKGLKKEAFYVRNFSFGLSVATIILVLWAMFF